MSAKRIGMMSIRQLLKLKQLGHSNRSIHRLTGIHRNTVNEYVRMFNALETSYLAIEQMGDKELAELFTTSPPSRNERYKILSGYFTYFHQELKKTGCTRLVLWKEYQNKHPGGYSYTQFNEHYNRWLKRVDGSGKLIHKAGDKLYVDYCGKKLSYIDKETGLIIETEVFVGVLPCSGYTFVEASRSQRRPDFIESMNNCLEFLGGVPQSIVPDNLKAAVTKGCKYEPVLNKTFADFGLHYGCSINPTRTYSPQDKALVENAVKLVYQRIFYPLSKQQFFSLEELNQQISCMLEQYNDQLLSYIKLSRRQQFEQTEQAELGALPATPYELRTYKKATVQKMGHILLSEDKHYYSVPHRYIGKKVEVQYNSKTVEIYHNNERIATHKRDYRPSRYSTTAEHMSSAHQFYNDWSPDFFIHKACKYGPYVEKYISGLLDQATYPETAYKQCMGVLQLAKDYSSGRLAAACKRAMNAPRFSYHTVREILKNKVDQQPDLFTQQSSSIPPHSNIRGKDYYDK